MNPFKISYLTASLILIVPVTALAVMPPETYREARRAADHHVQVEIGSVKTPKKTPGKCFVQGTVAKTFSSKGDVLSKGTPVTFSIDCLRPGDEPMAGGTLWGSADELAAARYIEVYLNGVMPPRMSVVRWQYTVIPALSEEPACPVDRQSITCW